MSASIELGWKNGKLQAGAAGAAAIVDKASARMKGALASIGQGVGVGAGFAIFDTLKNTITGSLSSIAEATVKLDSMRLGMTVLEGSTEGANARIQEMRDLAKLPGLGFEQVVQGDIRLRSAGLSASVSKRAIEEMGNALAAVGRGKADMDGVILALSQIASKGKVSAEEINQIAERVPQIRAILKGTFGTADTEAIQKMGIPVERFIDMVIEGFSKTVPRAMIGLRGGWENLTDAMTAAAAGFGEGIGTSLSDPMNDATGAFEKNAKQFQSAGALIGDVTSGVITVVGGLASVIKFAADGIGYMATRFAMLLPGAREASLAFEQMQTATVRASDAEKELSRNAVDLARHIKENDEATKRATESRIRSAQVTIDEARAENKLTAERIKAVHAARDLLSAERKRTRDEYTPPETQVEEAKARILALDKQINAVIGQPGSEEITNKLLAEQEREKRLILQLNKEILANQERINEENAKEAERVAQVRADQETNLKNLDLELAILNAQASGHDRKAKQLEHQRDVQEETARIVADTGLAYADAARKAEQLVSAKEKVANGRDGNGRRKIKGYSQQQDGVDEFGMQNAIMTPLDGEGKQRHGSVGTTTREEVWKSMFSPSSARVGDLGARTPATDTPKGGGDSEVAAVIKGFTEQTIEIFKQALA